MRQAMSTVTKASVYSRTGDDTPETPSVAAIDRFLDAVAPCHQQHHRGDGARAGDHRNRHWKDADVLRLWRAFDFLGAFLAALVIGQVHDRVHAIEQAAAQLLGELGADDRLLVERIADGDLLRAVVE